MSCTYTNMSLYSQNDVLPGRVYLNDWLPLLHSMLTLSAGQEIIIFFLGAQPGDKKFLQTNEVFFC